MQQILLAGSGKLLIEGLKRVLHGTYEVTGVAFHPADIERLAVARPPTLLIYCQDRSGWRFSNVALHVAKLPSPPRIIALVPIEDFSPASVLAIGSCSPIQLPTTASVEELMQAIQTILSTEPQKANGAGAAKDHARKDTSLTARQLEILGLITDGLPVKIIAERMEISPRTVEFHKYKIMRHLRVGSVAELVLFAIDAGLIRPRFFETVA